MNLAHADAVARAVLYEGYMLYPYRPSSVKNRQRWTFGGVYPQAYSQAQSGADAWAIQAECLVAGRPSDVELDIRARFLHLVARTVGALDAPLAALPSGAEPDLRLVDALEIDGQLFQTWQEATEREICAGLVGLSTLLKQPQRHAFALPAQREIEPLRSSDGLVAGAIQRTQQPLAGAIEIAATPLGDALARVTARVLNLGQLEEGQAGRDEALLRAFISTHIILGVAGGEFVSLLDPPEQLRAAADACQNTGVWPVLVGEAGAHDTMLASPIILYDYPEIAPESPGDLFDATEIDEILTLRIMTMTEAEKREMGAADPHARALLERTEALAREQLMQLHGTMRGLRPPEGSR